MTLESFFEENPRVALAFSGGTDSAFLLWAAVRWAKEVRAYYVRTAFQPEFEFQDALRLAGELRADLRVLELDILSAEGVAENPADRCYRCKRRLFGAICAAAAADGFPVVLDGTNASDSASDRPGMRALTELQVRSPLRECGISKAEVRRLSREAGLFTWDKPAYACLATRIPTGERLTEEKLRRAEASEAFLRELGFRDFRVRQEAGRARLQVRAEQLPLVLERREILLQELKKQYSTVLLDLEARI